MAVGSRPYGIDCNILATRFFRDPEVVRGHAPVPRPKAPRGNQAATSPPTDTRRRPPNPDNPFRGVLGRTPPLVPLRSWRASSPAVSGAGRRWNAAMPSILQTAPTSSGLVVEQFLRARKRMTTALPPMRPGFGVLRTNWRRKPLHWRKSKRFCSASGSRAKDEYIRGEHHGLYLWLWVTLLLTAVIHTLIHNSCSELFPRGADRAVIFPGCWGRAVSSRLFSAFMVSGRAPWVLGRSSWT